MLEVKLPREIDGRNLANLIEKSMRKKLVPRGYRIRTFPFYQSHYSHDSRELVKVEVERTIDAHKEMEGGTKESWGYAHIFASDDTFGVFFDLEEPKFDLGTRYRSFSLFVVERHVTPHTENSYTIEPHESDYKNYKKDVKSLIDELYKQLDKTKQT